MFEIHLKFNRKSLPSTTSARDYAKSGDASELTSWAQKTLPALQQHLQHAQALPQNPAQVGQAPAGGAGDDQHNQRPDRSHHKNQKTKRRRHQPDLKCDQ
jgi:hypothetical protein